MSARDDLRDCFLSDSRDRFETAADAYRAEILREVADEIEAIDFHPNAAGSFLGVCRQLAGRFRRKANEGSTPSDGSWKPWGGHDRYCSYVAGIGKCNCAETPVDAPLPSVPQQRGEAS